MEDKNFRYLGLRIRKEREEQHVSLGQLATRVSIDKGYLSKIETGNRTADIKLLYCIYEKLHIRLECNEHVLLKMNNQLEHLVNKTILLEENQAKIDIHRIRNNELKYMNSELFVKFILYEAFYSSEFENVKNENKTILNGFKKIENLYDALDNNEKQMYDYVLGVYYYTENQIVDSIVRFKNCICFGEKTELYGLANDGIAIALSYMGKYMESYYYESEAIKNFSNKMNIKRYEKSMVFIAELYSKNGEYELSEVIYTKLRKENKMITKESIEKFRISNYVRCRQYESAYKIICAKKKNYYMVACDDDTMICVYNLNKTDDLKRIMLNYKSFGNQTSSVFKTIELLELKHTSTQTGLIEKEIKNSFNTLSCDQYKKLIELIVKYYDENGKYKREVKWLKKLVMLKQ